MLASWWVKIWIHDLLNTKMKCYPTHGDVQYKPFTYIKSIFTALNLRECRLKFHTAKNKFWKSLLTCSSSILAPVYFFWLLWYWDIFFFFGVVGVEVLLSFRSAEWAATFAALWAVYNQQNNFWSCYYLWFPYATDHTKYYKIEILEVSDILLCVGPVDTQNIF
jgi:hypothetical protein